MVVAKYVKWTDATSDATSILWLAWSLLYAFIRAHYIIILYNHAVRIIVIYYKIL